MRFIQVRIKQQYIPRLLENSISNKGFKLKLFYDYFKHFCFLEKHFLLEFPKFWRTVYI